MNPILYCWKITEVRQAVKNTIKTKCCLIYLKLSDAKANEREIYNNILVGVLQLECLNLQILHKVVFEDYFNVAVY